MTAATPQRAFWDAPGRAVLLVAIGALAGPHGLDVLRLPTLELVQPLLPVALAALGALAWRAPGRRLAMQLAPVAAAALLMLALAGEVPDPTEIVWRATRAAVSCAPALLVGGAGWLLLGKTTSDTERRVFVLALLLMVGGIADFVAVPALLLGAAAGLVVSRLGASPRETVILDLEYLSRPLTAGLLVILGARVVLSDAVLMLAAIQIAVALVIYRLSATRPWATGTFAIAVACDAELGLFPAARPLVDATVIAVVAIHMAAMLFLERDNSPATVPPSAPDLHKAASAIAVPPVMSR
jgi:hypothetical protein